MTVNYVCLKICNVSLQQKFIQFEREKPSMLQCNALNKMLEMLKINCNDDDLNETDVVLSFASDPIKLFENLKIKLKMNIKLL